MRRELGFILDVWEGEGELALQKTPASEALVRMLWQWPLAARCTYSLKGAEAGLTHVRVDRTGENVGDGVACLLPWHEVCHNRLHLGRPGHKDGARDCHDDDCVGVGRSDRFNQRVLWANEEAPFICSIILSCA
eukprot:COSAG03_NODE_543_length_7031_cov_4.570831_2_plen_134_part_00